MKIIVTIIRIFTGVLFIFSGVVKAIDPKGLAYKMQEFFEAWSNEGIMPKLMKYFEAQALPFSIIMITLEVAVGIALLVGYKKRITTWILILLMIFFTFLTSNVLFSGKIKACGCFGDCIPLTPIQTFSKDILLLLFSVILMIGIKYITPIAKPLFSFLYVAIVTIFIFLLQQYVLKNLPLVDCLPYKKTNNILELRKMPANAVADKFEYLFTYEKNGDKQDFKASAIPDSTWKFIDRKQTLIQKGSNNIPIINDYSLSSESGTDTTSALLNTKGEYYLLYVKDLDNYPTKWDGDAKIIIQALEKNKPIYVVTSQLEMVKEHFKNIEQLKNVLNKVTFLTCDGIVLKTVARVNPTLYLMDGPIVKNKWSWNSFENLNIEK